MREQLKGDRRSHETVSGYICSAGVLSLLWFQQWTEANATDTQVRVLFMHYCLISSRVSDNLGLAFYSAVSLLAWKHTASYCSC